MHFYLFVYGTLRGGPAAHDVLAGCARVGGAQLNGTLYDIDGEYPALLLYGDGVVQGEVWWCPTDRLSVLDAYERVGDGLFRRLGVMVRGDDGVEYPCWVYAAGPALASRLTRDRRLDAVEWHQPAASAPAHP